MINAFEAMNGRGRVAIAAHTRLGRGRTRRTRRARRGAVIVVDVLRRRPGMPPELADRIFNPFFTTKAQGSGLGLAIVRKIVDAHDGRIDLRSAPGEGTRFTVTLPVTGADGQWFT